MCEDLKLDYMRSHRHSCSPAPIHKHDPQQRMCTSYGSVLGWESVRGCYMSVQCRLPRLKAIQTGCMREKGAIRALSCMHYTAKSPSLGPRLGPKGWLGPSLGATPS